MFIKLWTAIAVIVLVALDFGLTPVALPRQYDRYTMPAWTASTFPMGKLFKSFKSQVALSRRDQPSLSTREHALSAVYFWPAPLAAYHYVGLAGGRSPEQTSLVIKEETSHKAHKRDALPAAQMNTCDHVSASVGDNAGFRAVIAGASPKMTYNRAFASSDIGFVLDPS
jgi:hypothetical protein